MKLDMKTRPIIKMSRYAFMFILISMSLIGCSEQSNVLAPDNNSNTSEPNWITLPQPTGMQVNKTVSTSKRIVGKYGGTINLNTSYTGGLYGNVTITSSLYFPQYAFSYYKTFTISHDDAACVSTFGPSMVFNKPLTLNITYTGVDLSGINPETVKFAYLAVDGSVEYAPNSGIIVDKSTGTLRVINAVIPHFSRYGFMN
jgi:hypothetical protein